MNHETNEVVETELPAADDRLTVEVPTDIQAGSCYCKPCAVEE